MAQGEGFDEGRVSLSDIEVGHDDPGSYCLAAHRARQIFCQVDEERLNYCSIEILED